MNVKDFSNDTLLVLFKNLNKQGIVQKLTSEQLLIYKDIKTEIDRRMDNTLPPWRYSLYPKGISKDLVLWDLVERIVNV